MRVFARLRRGWLTRWGGVQLQAKWTTGYMKKANATFIKDEEMLNRLMNTNPSSFQELVQTFLEANGRENWKTS